MRRNMIQFRLHGEAIITTANDETGYEVQVLKSRIRELEKEVMDLQRIVLR